MSDQPISGSGEQTAPEDDLSATTAPAETAPSDTAPSDTAPPDTAPAETAPSGTAPPDTAPSDTAPAATSISDARPVESEAGQKRPNRRKVREGLVVSISMDKTAVVASVDRVRHPRYVKTVQRTKRLYAHDENNETRIGDRVRIAETRPMSKLKRWRLVEILERAK